MSGREDGRQSVTLTLGEIGRMVAAAYPGTAETEVDITLIVEKVAADTHVTVSWTCAADGDREGRG